MHGKRFLLLEVTPSETTGGASVCSSNVTHN